MKTLLTLLIAFISFAASAQVIAEYRYSNGKLYGVDSIGNFIQLPQIKYGKEPLPEPIVNYHPPADFVVPENIKEVISTPVNDTEKINKAGKLFISSSILIIASGALTAAGIATDTPELTYAGAGVSAVSVFTTLAAGVQLMRFKFPKSEMSVSAGAIKMNF